MVLFCGLCFDCIRLSVLCIGGMRSRLKIPPVFLGSFSSWGKRDFFPGFPRGAIFLF